MKQSANAAAPDPGASGDGVGVWGLQDMMALAGMRHCLGRSSYMVDICADWMLANWHHWRVELQALMRSDIDEFFAWDDQARANGDESKPLGLDRDRAAWERVRALWTSPGA